MAGERILAVDDEPLYREVLCLNLEIAGYVVTSAATGEQALAALAEGEPDLIILDLMLPGVDGFEVCRRVRERSTCPIIILTAKGAEDDKILGLRLGADDYITKPFSAQELLARVEAVLRRARPPEHPERARPTVVVGDLRIDERQKKVTLGEQELPLSPTEYRLLACLAARAGTILSRDELLTEVWGDAYKRDDDLLRTTLRRLRRRLGDDAGAPRYIVTRPGLGYMLAPPD